MGGEGIMVIVSALEDRVKFNYQKVVENIIQAAVSVDRDPTDIRLVVVTKGHPLEVVRTAVKAGAVYLGENYVEEALPKIHAMKEKPGIEWHMIGHVQSRKAQLVSENFTLIHSLDRLKLALKLDRFAGEIGRRIPILLECNVSGEETKYGWQAWEESLWPGLVFELENVVRLPNIAVCGLMTMAPMFDDPEKTRPIFQKLRRLQRYLLTQFPWVEWKELSMGMSADYEVAIQEGATLVRVGTAILGERIG